MQQECYYERLLKILEYNKKRFYLQAVYQIKREKSIKKNKLNYIFFNLKAKIAVVL